MPYDPEKVDVNEPEGMKAFLAHLGYLFIPEGEHASSEQAYDPIWVKKYRDDQHTNRRVDVYRQVGTSIVFARIRSYHNVVDAMVDIAGLHGASVGGHGYANLEDAIYPKKDKRSFEEKLNDRLAEAPEWHGGGAGTPISDASGQVIGRVTKAINGDSRVFEAPLEDVFEAPLEDVFEKTDAMSWTEPE